MKNKKGFTLVEVIISWIIITIIILNVATFFLFAWKLKVRFEEDRAVLGILTSYIEAKKAQVIGTTTDRNKLDNYPFAFSIRSEFEYWKQYCIKMWDYDNTEKKTLYPPLVYPLPSTKKFDIKKIDDKKYDKFIKIEYQWCKLEIERTSETGDNAPKPQYFLMPSMYVWCIPPNSNKPIGMHVTNAMPWRNYNNGHNDDF